MRSAAASERPGTPYVPAEYWDGLAEKHSSADAYGFAPVLHPDAPIWFNRLIDREQFHTLCRALSVAKVQLGARILDVGCGTGRWIRRYQEASFRPIGIDAHYGMLRTARMLSTNAPLVTGDACRLPFSDNAFDIVSDVTVIQHIPEPHQQQAIAEMLRVLRPEGHLVLMELIRGEGKHIFPRSPEGWIRLGSSGGAKLKCWFGQEFFFADRCFVGMARSILGQVRAGIAGVNFSQTKRKVPMAVARRVFWGVRRFTTLLDSWSDPIVEKIGPARAATHGVFVLQK